MIETKLTLRDATPELLQKTAQDVSGVKLAVKAEHITECINPLKIVETYKVKGGPAPTEVERALSVRKKRIDHSKSNVSKLKQKLASAESKLESTVNSYSLSNPPTNIKFKNSNL